MNSAWLGVLASWPVEMLMTALLLAALVMLRVWRKAGRLLRAALYIILISCMLYFTYILLFELI